MRSKYLRFKFFLLVFGVIGVLSIIMLSTGQLSYKINKNAENYIILRTSFVENKSKLEIYSEDKKINEESIGQGALNSLIKHKNDFYISSRYKGDYYILSKNGRLIKKRIESGKGITNTFYNNDKITFITNWGQKKEKGIISYTSGIYLLNAKSEPVEFVLNNGFFTSGTFFNNHIYVLTFDPTVKEEQILKVNFNGEIVKKFVLGRSPRFEFRSITTSNDLIYMYSNDGKLLFIDTADNLQEIPLTNGTGKVFKIFPAYQGIHVLFYNGVFIQIKQNKVNSVLKLQNESNEHLISIQSKIKGKVLHVLYTFDKAYYGKSYKYEGLIRQYSIDDGSVLANFYLEKLDNLRLVDFDITNN